MFNLLLITAIIVLIFTLLVLVFFKDRPSYEASVAVQVSKEEFGKTLKILIKNTNNMYLVYSFSLLLGSYILFNSYIFNLLAHYNIK